MIFVIGEKISITKANYTDILENFLSNSLLNYYNVIFI